jgi:hypothetical protein
LRFPDPRLDKFLARKIHTVPSTGGTYRDRERDIAGIRKSTDLPDGQISELVVQPHLQKYFPSRQTQIKSISPAVPPHTEGRIMIVANAGRDAVDADAPLTNGADADGQVVWS